MNLAIDWNAFTPASSLLGGALIGLAAALLLAGTGRIAGIAGLLGTAWQALRQQRSFHGQGLRWTFVLGLLLAPWVWLLGAPLPAVQAVAGLPLTLLAGLLVGIGVRLGNGCTSGHGVCGLSRGSLRSLANVLAFMTSGMLTVTLLRGVLA
jgi:uncharacterized protein